MLDQHRLFPSLDTLSMSFPVGWLSGKLSLLFALPNRFLYELVRLPNLKSIM
jgi:hypothetical protein